MSGENKPVFRRGLAADIPTLRPGEPGWATDTKDLYVGHADGNINITGSRLGFRNRIIGGDFSTNPWQRGTSFTNMLSSATSMSVYTADRFSIVAYVDTLQVNVYKTADRCEHSPYCLHVDVTTAESPLTTSSILGIAQSIEGYNIIDFEFGQSGTRYLTLSFWVKATKTGTYCVTLTSYNTTRIYTFEYTVSSSNTWEKVEKTIPIDTSGTWKTDNDIGLSIFFCIAADISTYGGCTADSWQDYGYASFVTDNQVNGVDSASNDFKLALIQLEPGNVATPFEFRPAAVERQLCQRYFWRGLPGEHFTQFTTDANQFVSWPIKFPVTMRDVPSVTYDGETLHSFSDLWVNVPTVDGCRLFAKSSGADANAYVEFSSSGYIEANAELTTG